MAEEKDLSIVIPAYREEGRILGALKAVDEHFFHSDIRYEVIVVEDGRLDGTGRAVADFSKRNGNVRLLTNDRNMGKGYAVKRGMLEAKGNLVLFSDADMATPIGEVEKFLPFFAEGFDVVIASRRLKGAKIRVYQRPLRRFFGWLFHTTRRMLILGDIKDTQCGFKCFKREAVREIFDRQSVNGFVFDVELLVIARKLGFKIKEVPVIWIDDARTTLSVAKHMKGIILDLLKVKWRSMTGKYN
jgi:dolichyl-phosphate beta-glucosyltransferase